jgi:excinuclease UvrABC ATPase subunit
VTSESRSSRNPQILFTFHNGASVPSPCELCEGRRYDASVVKDYNQRATSPDGIY